MSGNGCVRVQYGNRGAVRRVYAVRSEGGRVHSRAETKGSAELVHDSAYRRQRRGNESESDDGHDCDHGYGPLYACGYE